MTHDTDVLVVGAGPVGLAMAIALRQWDLRVRIVDRATGLNREPRADVLFPRAGEALGAIGAGELIRTNAYEMRDVTIFGDGEPVGACTVGRLSSRYPRPMTIEQHEIEKLLGGHLATLGVTVEWRTAVTSVESHADRAEVTVRRPDGVTESVSVPWVVACDGMRSTVRAGLGIPYDGAPRQNMQVLQGNVVPTWPLPDAAGHGYFFLAPYRTIISFPTPSGGYRIFCVRDDPDPTIGGAPTLEELRDVVAEASGISDLKLSLTERVWLNRARFADRVARTLRSGRVLLVGDAAHSWAPIGGHGMNVGVLGAHNLAWKLACVHRDGAPETLLDSYDVEQRRLAQGVIRDMRRNVLEILLPRRVHRLRCVLLRLCLPLSAVQRRSEWMMSDFGRHHRRSALSWHRSRRGKLRAGDRLPDVPVVSALNGDAGPVRLHDLLAYDRWTVLVPADGGGDGRSAGALREACERAAAPIRVVPIHAADSEAAAALQWGRRLIAVRPDGYIGLITGRNRTDVLRAYVETFLRATRSSTVRER
jgi:2-polyprenyl-6-methoxyphenol hydroxylase-like FAD-dependent oxidoreductase